MAADCSYFRSSRAFMTDCAPYCSADGSALLLRSTRQRLFRRFARCIAQRMAADCSFLHSSMAFTPVCTPYCSADGSGLLILLLVNGFHDGFRAVLLSGWQRIAHTSALQRLSRRFARCMAQRMAADCSFFRSSTAFTTVRVPYGSADGSGFLILLLVNGFHDGLRAVLLSGWQWIAYSSAAFPTVCAPYCSADGSALLILLLFKGFHDGLRAVLLSGWQRIAHTSALQRLSRRIARCIAQWMAAHCSYFRSSMAFTTICTPYCSADDSGLLILPLTNRFHNDLRAVSLCEWLGGRHYCSVVGSLISSACR